MNHRPGSRYVIVERQPIRGRWLWLVIVPLWAASLALAWHGAVRYVAPGLPALADALDAARDQLRQRQAEVQALRQREATLRRSDQISRAANHELQASLAARDRQLADLREDLAFYERLAGGAAQRKGLKVHSAAFSAEPGGTWRYRIVLTQGRRRDAPTLGELRFAVEGVREGKLATVGWDQLHQKPAAPARDYSFRYFQQLNGSVMLPPGFTPQRVRVYLHGKTASLEQTLAWQSPAATGGT
jgi:uncharacterized membrane protein